MKRYRLTRQGSGFGFPLQHAVIELANDASPPEGAVEVPVSTELHEWRSETTAEQEARIVAERGG